MIKAILYKEWIKTRRVFLLLLVLGIILAVYAVLGVRRIEATKGVEHVWMIMLLKDQTFMDVLKYFPLLAGIVAGIAQMVPEMSHKRLKLTLHLPFPQARMFAIMLGMGLAQLLLIFVIQTGVTIGYYSTILPSELMSRVLLTMLPWMLCGLNAYLFVAAVCIEGERKMRVILGLIGIATLALYFKQTVPEAYNGFLPMLTIGTLLCISLVYYSLIRFKEGRQD